MALFDEGIPAIDPDKEEPYFPENRIKEKKTPKDHILGLVLGLCTIILLTVILVLIFH